MSDSTRRRFIGVAGAGAVAAGAVSVLPGSTSAQARRTADSAVESVVAHVGDIHSAEITLLVGEREVVVQDRDLVIRLLNAAGR